jgi:hypothetical protein
MEVLMTGKIIRIYIENSVIGGYFEEEYGVFIKALFDLFRNGTFISVISEHVFKELNNGAPVRVIENLKTLNYECRKVTPGMVRLADEYISRKIVSINFYDDALHVAIATILGVDALVSTNFRHIVHKDKIPVFNAVNIEKGLNKIRLLSPEDIVNAKGIYY